jgi:hypothetical protein
MNEQHIEHEVRMRVLKEMADFNQKLSNEKFDLLMKRIDDRFSRVNFKLNLIIIIQIATILMPFIKTALSAL